MIATAHFLHPDEVPKEPRAALDYPLVDGANLTDFRNALLGRTHPDYPWLRCAAVTFRLNPEDVVEPDFIVGEASE